jgi:hypothetical protein
MKLLTSTALSLLLISLASVSYGQDIEEYFIDGLVITTTTVLVDSAADLQAAIAACEGHIFRGYCRAEAEAEFHRQALLSDESVICSASYRIQVTGTIGPDSSFALSELIDRPTPCLDPQGNILNPTVVSLSSSGGLLNDGYAMGKAIRDANTTTLIRDGDICASACAVAYLGGVKRIMQGESYVMFHAPYNVQPSNNLGSLVVNCDIGQDNLDELNNYYRDMLGFEAGDRLFDRTMSYCSAEDGWVLRGPASAELFGVATEK